LRFDDFLSASGFAVIQEIYKIMANKKKYDCKYCKPHGVKVDGAGENKKGFSP
jgi:hypothetical protein